MAVSSISIHSFKIIARSSSLCWLNDPDCDRYYLWDIDESKPLIVVSQNQVERLLTEINSRFNLKLTITDSQREEGFVNRFPYHPRCRPRYLGRSQTKEEYERMTSDVPGVLARTLGELDPPSLDARLIEDFKVMIADAWQMTKNKSKASKEKKRVDRMQKLKLMTDELKRAQRYLGLRPTATEGTFWLSNVLDCYSSH